MSVGSKIVACKIAAVVLACEQSLAVPQRSLPQAEGVPKWCSEFNLECQDVREDLCEASPNPFDRRGIGLLTCILGEKPEVDENAEAGPQVSPSQPSVVIDRRDDRGRERRDRRGDRRRGGQDESGGDRSTSRPSRQVVDRRTQDPVLDEVSQRRLDECVDAILLGPERKRIRISGHEFNCKPPYSFEALGNLWVFNAELSHHLTARADDQVDYSFTIAPDGAIDDFDVNIQRGGLFATINQVSPVNRINQRLDPGYWTTSTFSRLAGRQFEGSWTDVASIVVLSVSNRLAQSFRGARRNLPHRGDEEFFYYIDIPGSDFRRIDLTGSEATPDMCSRQCTYDRECEAWTFHRPVMNKRAARCWLKSSAPPVSIKHAVVSGRKQARAASRRR